MRTIFFHLVFNAPLERVYRVGFGHYLAWAQILKPQATFPMNRLMLLYCNSWSDSIWPSSSTTGESSSHHNRIPSMLYGGCDSRGVWPFHWLFAAHRSSYVTWDFELGLGSLNDIIPLRYFSVFKHYGIDIVLLLQQWFPDSNSAI